MFNKDPSHLPLSLRNQIYNWLSNSPSEMESYIKPGCIVLSLYLSMSSSAWNKLEENFLSYVKSLVNYTNDAFWRNGRVLVYTDRKMASHKDGAIRLWKSWRDWNTTELISVSPVAIVAGQETSLLLRGRNLTAPNTTIHCTHADGMIRESAIIEENGQISISIKDGMKPFQVEMNDDQGPKSSSCPKCAVAAAQLYSTRFSSGLLHRPYIHSILVVAAVCVCVCLLLRGHPNTSLNSPLVWENLR